MANLALFFTYVEKKKKSSWHRHGGVSNMEKTRRNVLRKNKSENRLVVTSRNSSDSQLYDELRPIINKCVQHEKFER